MDTKTQNVKEENSRDKLTASQLLSRAHSIITSGPLPPSYSEHGEYCVFCALALAKTQLDEELGTGLTNEELQYQMLFGVQTVPSDMPVIEARRAISKYMKSLNINDQQTTRDQALSVIGSVA